ncbi:EAL domain-containing protein [Sphingomonas piscis]|uniref:EAL domain-containing protein n=1 Tax=Sphingomonas piscis TaxID=2714943 RepID=A0A6G7YQ34_9SPHN|nr:EAL domain-containing protein [Sphingomonas piscis]QIK78852.1 EAL domain-containing protein [Sphingomonas piscis]
MNEVFISNEDACWQHIRGQLSGVLDAADVGAWRLDLHTGLATWDSVASRIINGTTAPQTTPCTLPIHPDDQPVAQARLKRAAQGLGAEPLAVRILRADGVLRWVKACGRPTVYEGSAARYLVGIVTDFTAEKEAQARIVESERQLSTLVNHLPGVAYRCALADPWPMTYVSQGVQALTGYSVTDFISGRIGWADIMHPDDLKAVAAEVDRAVHEQRSFDVSYRLSSADGSERWVQERGRAHYDNGEAKFLEGFIWDISDAKSAEARTRWMANHDALTGLPNRVLLEELVRAKIAAGDKTFAVLLLDVDDFKRINDTLGHSAGDALLKEFARRFSAVIGGDGTVGRLGGDEFAILVDDGGTQDLGALGKRIIEALSAPIENDLGLLAASVSVGASIFGPHGKTWTELLKNADIALYAAKAAGRGNLKLFSNSMLNELQVRSSMLALAGSAIERGGIIPHYQPQVDLGSGAITGFEALLRWEGPGGRLELPDQISAAFDDPLLAAQLSEQMIGRVVNDMRDWLDHGTPFNHVAINASPAQFRTGDFADRLLERLSRADVPPSKLQVEVTETVFLGRGSRYVETALTALNQAGVGIALDDFGTGYASLLHLAQYPVKVLKVDRSFVQRMLSSSQDDAIIQAVISLGHSLGMKVVAEGVETLEQVARLRAKKCDFAQGFFYAAALPASKVDEFCVRAEPSRRRYAG